MRDTLMPRLYTLLLALSVLWVLLGSPVFAEEWQDIPHRLHLMATQLPGRLSLVFSSWH